jgi:hypothetical protein
VLADVKVVALDRGLGALQELAHQAVLDGKVVAHLLHELGQHLAPSEAAHEVVFQGEVKARRARFSLAAGAATELVVDAPGFVALGAQDVQATLGQDLLPVAGILGRHLGDGAVHLGRRGGKGIETAGLEGLVCAMDDLVAQLAAQLDVHAAPGHVGGDGHRARLSGPGDDGCLAGVLLGVEDLVGMPSRRARSRLRCAAGSSGSSR